MLWLAIPISRCLCNFMQEDKADKKQGLPPIFNAQSKVLILGSFPSVKSREIAFYYGHKQNRFWPMLCSYFGVDVPNTNADKRTFLLEHSLALWDMAMSCRVNNSADSNIKDVQYADLSPIFLAADIRLILLNGQLAYKLFEEKYADCSIPYRKMPSTSPANPRYDQMTWWRALDDVFKIT